MRKKQKLKKAQFGRTQLGGKGEEHLDGTWSKSEFTSRSWTERIVGEKDKGRLGSARTHGSPKVKRVRPSSGYW